VTIASRLTEMLGFRESREYVGRHREDRPQRYVAVAAVRTPSPGPAAAAGTAVATGTAFATGTAVATGTADGTGTADASGAADDDRADPAADDADIGAEELTG
jgi:hypothetical protein